MKANKFENETFDYTYTYRNVTVQVWNDDYGQQKFLRFLNDPLFGTLDIGLGSFNTNIEEDIKFIIDNKLDTIKRFDSPYHGAKLAWFQNGLNDNYDIQLTYRTRILKIWLVADRNKIDLNKIIDESVEILKKVIV